MSAPIPKTVTFNAEPQTEAAYRSARLGSRVIGATLGVAAVVLAVVALIFNIDVAIDLAETWPQAFKLGLIAVAITLALCGLPVASALISASYPAEARQAMVLWAGAMTLSAVGMLFFVVGAGSPPLSAEAKARIEQLRESIRIVPRADFDVWQRSSNCRTPANSADRAVCDRIAARDWHARREVAALEAGWSPRAVIGAGQVASMGRVGAFLRRLMIAALSIAAIAGAGFLGRLAVLSAAESYRLAEGTATPTAAPAPPMPAGGPPALVSPLETTQLWFQARVAADPEGRLSPPAAYDDYEEACRVNGQPAMPRNSFYNFLAAKAKASGGMITRVKSNGQHLYAGWSLAEADMGALPGGEDLLALPYRS